MVDTAKKLGIRKIARNARQDDSAPLIKKLINLGYDKAIFHIHELLHQEKDICDLYNGKTFDLRKLISNLQHNAPIFELSHPNCLDKETQVYTDQGWKYFYDLDKSEKVATLNQESSELEWQKPVAYIKKKYKGELYNWKSSTMDALSTPEHKWLVNQNWSNKKVFKTTEELLKSDSPKRLQVNYEIPSFVKYEGSKEKIIIGDLVIDQSDYAKLMGYYLSEGCTDASNNSIRISQHKKDNIETIYEDLLFLEELGIHVNKYNYGLQFSKKDLYDYLVKFGKCFDKYIPEEVKNLSKENINKFIDAYVLGDGYVQKRTTGKTRRIFTASDRMSSDFAEIILKSGHSLSYNLIDRAKYKLSVVNGIEIKPNKKYWEINIKDRLYLSTRTLKVEKISYNDYVYCVTVPNSTILVRRSGKVYWTGNCNCYLMCYSSTNSNLETVVVNWTGISEEGRVVDKTDSESRKQDFYKLFDEYKKELQEIQNNQYISGQFSEPDAGIYSFEITLFDDTYFNTNELNEIRDKILEVLLDSADKYGVRISDASISGNHIIVETENGQLSNYDFSKQDWMDIEWNYLNRRQELVNVIMDLDKLRSWLKTTQDSINRLLLDIEQQNSTSQYVDQVEKYGMLQDPLEPALS